MAKVEGEKVPASVSHHLIVQGESYKSLVDYMKRNPACLSKQPPGQSETQSAPEPSHLDGTTRLLLFLLIDMMDDLVSAGIYLEKLKAEHIAVLSNGRPKLIGASFKDRKGLPGKKEFKDKVSGNFNDLAVIIIQVVLAAVSRSLPADMIHLLFLMRNHACAMRFLINHHQAIVPLENHTTLYLRVHHYVWDILRWKDPRGFEYLMSNLEFDPRWRKKIEHNKHLVRYYNSSYENNCPPGTIAHMLKETRQVSRFNRNGPSHPLECALNPSSVDGMFYSQCAGLGHIYLSHFARITYSLQVGLQAINKLKLVEIRSLFSSTKKDFVEI